MVAQTTEDTGLAPAGVIDTKPLTGETLPGDEFADRPQAAASAHTAAAMIIHRRGHLFTCASPPHIRLRISITNWPPPPAARSLTDVATCHHPSPDLTRGHGHPYLLHFGRLNGD